MILLLENRIVNFANVTSYEPQKKLLEFAGPMFVDLTETQNTMLHWFLTELSGNPLQTGVFDVGTLYEKREEVAVRRKKMQEAQGSNANLEQQLSEVAEQYEQAKGKKLTPEQITQAREVLARTQMKLIPIDQRKQ